MKTLRLFLALGLMCLTLTSYAQDSEGQTKKRIRTNYINFLKEEGYVPSIDADGDIKFKIDGSTYYVVIADQDSPAYVTLWAPGYTLGGDGGYDIVKVIPIINKTNIERRGVKFLYTDKSVIVRMEMLLPNAESFKNVFYTSLSYLKSSRELFEEEYSKSSNVSVIQPTSTGVASENSFEEIGDFHNELARVKANGKWGYVNKNFKIIIPIEYEDASKYVTADLLSVKKEGKWGCVDKINKIVIPFKYDSDLYFDRETGLAHVNIGDMNGYVTPVGIEAIPLKYKSAATFFKEGLSPVKETNLYGYIDVQGRLVIPYKYSYAQAFSQGLAAVEYNDRYGFINREGKVLIPFKFDDASDFDEGLAVVKLKGKYGCINTKGKVVIPIKYDKHFYFSSGIAAVVLNGKEIKIDTKGKVVD